MDPKWHIAFLNISITDFAGVTFREYYDSPAATLEAQLRAAEEAERRYGVGRFIRPFPDVPVTGVTGLFGMRKVFAEDDQLPWLDQQSYAFNDMAELDNVRVQLPEENAGLARRVQAWEYYHSQGYEVGLGGAAGSLVTDACDVSANAFLTALVEAPERARQLLELVTDTDLAIRQWSAKVSGKPAGHYIGDDFAGLLSPAMFREFVAPCYERVYAGASHRFMHSELLNVEHLRIAREELRINYYHGAGAEKLTLEEMHEVMGQDFCVQITPQEIIDLSPSQIAERIRVLAGSGADTVQIYPGRLTPPEHLEAAIEAARRECAGGPKW